MFYDSEAHFPFFFFLSPAPVDAAPAESFLFFLALILITLHRCKTISTGEPGLEYDNAVPIIKSEATSPPTCCFKC